ncbi:MAG: CcmD family protein [Bacteroidota bacterium]|nr:CcmD family protein [Bacteroidota bacterium]
MRYLFILIVLCNVHAVQAQDISPDYMRSTGKIYVVAGVTIVILLTLFIYLVMLDRKISRLEKRHKNE